MNEKPLLATARITLERRRSRNLNPHPHAPSHAHAVTTQIPDPRQHMVRYYGAYANRARRLYRAPLAEPAAGKASSSGPRPDEDEQDLWVRERRRSWARLIARIYEVDPLLCPRCGDELKVVSPITDPRVIDRILEHRRKRDIRSPFESRAPPAA